MQVQSLGWEDPLEEEMGTHPSILAWEVLRREKPSGLQFIGSQRVGHNWSNWVWTCMCVCVCMCVLFSSVHFSCSVMSDSLWLHGLQHARLTCPSPTPRAYSNSSALSQWCHPTISSSVVSFSSWLQSFPASGSFPMSQLFESGGQSIGVSASTLILPRTLRTDFL